MRFWTMPLTDITRAPACSAPWTARAAIVRRVAGIGVDEMACLIDYGIDTDLALADLPNIKRLMDAIRAEVGLAARPLLRRTLSVTGSRICNAPRRWRRCWLAMLPAGRRWGNWT